jgi:glucose/arabinose dehydrogenase
VVVQGKLPEDKHHGWKFLRFGPDGKLYVPVGAPCNVCDVEDPYASLLRMDAATGEYDVYARGIRNTVGFDWRPGTDELWFTDNGRDMMGDDMPADELNRITEAGQHFGFPFCHQGDTPDPEFSDRGACSDTVPPVQKLGPHVAAVGMRFYRGDAFPERLRGQVLIAEHGSWNRSDPIGYRITAVTLDAQGKATGYETLVDGWLQGKKGWGRPADVLELPDGSLLISDDLQGVIYLLSYTGAAPGAAQPSPADGSRR